MCSLMSKSLAVFQKSYLSIHSFLLQMPKIAFFLRKMVLSEVLYHIEVQLVINWSSRLQKHQTLKILTKVEI